jgi:osmotically-inducible protein OsmY
VAGGRSADDIQRDIERSRAELATAVDQLAYRTNPKRLVEQAKQTLRDRANSPQGRIVIGVSGGVVVVLIGLRIRKAVKNR